MSHIPNIYHFVYGLKPQKEPFHLAHYLSLISCLRINEPDMIMFHYKYLPYGDWWDKIKPFLTLNEVENNSFMSAYKYTDKIVARYRYAHFSDITRLEMLLQFGGIYADIDTIFVNKLPPDFFSASCIMGMEQTDPGDARFLEAGGSLCNAWIASEKDGIFIRRWLDEIPVHFDGSWNAHSTYLPYRLSRQMAAAISVEPERSFFYFDWTREGIAQIFCGNEDDLDGIYSIHLWSHLWWSPHRNDFSKFNNLMINREYILHANTTFANLTRRFLL